MKLTKQDKEMLRVEYSKTWRSEKSVEYAVSQASGYAEIGDCIVVFDKPRIETWFCFGEHGYDYDEVNEHCERMSNSEEYFINENMRDFDRIEKCIERARSGEYAAWLCHSDSKSDLGYVTFTGIAWGGGYENPTGYEPVKLTEAGIDVYAELIADERAKFDKRLRTYLKRYGMSKCRFWTYWADR